VNRRRDWLCAGIIVPRPGLRTVPQGLRTVSDFDLRLANSATGRYLSRTSSSPAHRTFFVDGARARVIYRRFAGAIFTFCILRADMARSRGLARLRAQRP